MIQESLYIHHSCCINLQGQMTLDGVLLHDGHALQHDDWYRWMQMNYIKYFKMDPLSKWTFIAAEALKQKTATSFPEETAIILHTHDGCIDVDHQFLHSAETLASPALFVYTLPNIMMGEIAIRHKCKGAQLLMVQENFDAERLVFDVQHVLNNNDSHFALCGWSNVYRNQPQVVLYWVNNQPSAQIFNEENCAAIARLVL